MLESQLAGSLFYASVAVVFSLFICRLFICYNYEQRAFQSLKAANRSGIIDMQRMVDHYNDMSRSGALGTYQKTLMVGKWTYRQFYPDAVFHHSQVFAPKS